jgi:hypothetical protein
MYDLNEILILNRYTFGNIAIIGDKQIKCYSSEGQLLISKTFNVREIHDFRLYSR